MGGASRHDGKGSGLADCWVSSVGGARVWVCSIPAPGYVVDGIGLRVRSGRLVLSGVVVAGVRGAGCLVDGWALVGGGA